MYNIYNSLQNTEQFDDTQQQIEQISKRFQPDVTSDFDIKQVRLIRTLGQGMNGAVSFHFVLQRNQ